MNDATSDSGGSGSGAESASDLADVGDGSESAADLPGVGDGPESAADLPGVGDGSESASDLPGVGDGSESAAGFAAASRSALRLRVERAVRALDDLPRGDEIGDRDLDPSLPRAGARRPAAVLVPIVERPHGHTVLLTRRTDHLHDHPGQVSFPGGRLDDTDRGPVAAALRETAEEIGLGREYVELAGLLDGYETVTGYGVTPVVAFVRPGFVLTLDAFEVAEAFEVPLAFFLDEASCRVDSGGLRRRYYAFEYADRYIWGATAGMLVNLRRRVAGR